METKKDNDVFDPISAFYVENETELFWSIESGAVCDENQIGKWHDQSYKSSLR